MNQEFIDLMRQVKRLEDKVNSLVKPEVPTWSTWSPNITQSVAVGRTNNFSLYRLSGDLVDLWSRLTITGAGVAGNAIQISNLPYNPSQVGTRVAVGTHVIFDSSVQNYPGIVVHSASGILQFFYTVSFVGLNPSFALASGDQIGFRVSYQRS